MDNETVLKGERNRIIEQLREEIRTELVGEAWKIVKLRIDYDRKHGLPAEETVTDLYDTAELKLDIIKSKGK